jgi:hypothetical protein
LLEKSSSYVISCLSCPMGLDVINITLMKSDRAIVQKPREDMVQWMLAFLGISGVKVPSKATGQKESSHLSS